RRRAGQFGHHHKSKKLDTEKGSVSPSPTNSYYGGHGNGNGIYGYGNGDYYFNNHRGPQIIHPEMEDMSSAKVYTALPTDTAVYWPPPLPTSSSLLQRSGTRCPQDHRRQEQLEQLLVLQREQIRELRNMQLQHQRENPLSSMSAPHAPTVQDRQIWQQSDQEQRQQWLQQQLPSQSGGQGLKSGTVVAGAVRDPQDWGSVGGGGGQEEAGVRDVGEGGEPSTRQDLREYIAQMKAQYEEQFRKHQEELDRLRLEQETRLQMLQDQIKA
ncbi:hypothetical protein BGX33_001791, partial [Mortierella sp. NVP41]